MKYVEVFVLCVMCMCTRPGMCNHLLLDMQGRGSSCDVISGGRAVSDQSSRLMHCSDL